MISKLKYKFVMTIMIIITIIFVGIIAAINIIITNANNTRAYNMLMSMAKNDGVRIIREPSKEQPPKDNVKPPENDIGESTHRKFDLNDMNSAIFTSVKLDDEGQIIETIADRAYLHSDEEIQSMVDFVINNNKDFGIQSDNYYIVQNKTYGKIIVFLESSMTFSNEYRLFVTSIIISSAAWIIIFVVSLLLVKSMIKPVSDAFEKQRRFISDASHELKTPVAVITTNADILHDEIGDNKWLSYIQSESRRMRTLINSLLTLAKLDNNKVDKDFAEFDMSKAIMSVALPFESTAFENNKNYSIDIEDDIKCFGNEEQIKQVAVILIDNAIKYSYDNGEISVTLKRSGNKKLFEVRNSGAGIPPEDIDKIFDRFYRADEARTRADGSVGLGLAIANAIINEHNGKITVHSKQNEYTVFQVIL